MPTRSRRRDAPSEGEAYDDEFSFVSEDDIAAFMAEQELEEEAHEDKSAGFWNLQTASGMGLIGVGVLYLFQLMGLFPLGSAFLFELVQVLPIFAAVLIMLTGFGVLSWSPAARKRRKARKRALRRRKQQRNAQRKTMGRGPSRRARTDEAGEKASAAFAQAEKVLRTAGETAGRAASAAAKEARQRRAKARRAGRTRLLKDRGNRKLTGVAAGMANYLGVSPLFMRIVWVIATIVSNGGAIVPYVVLSMALGSEGDDDDADPYVRVVDV